MCARHWEWRVSIPDSAELIHDQNDDKDDNNQGRDVNLNKYKYNSTSTFYTLLFEHIYYYSMILAETISFFVASTV